VTLSIRRQISYLVVRALCVSACGLAAGVRTEPSFDSGGALLGKVVAVNGLSTQLTVSSFRASTCRVAEGMTEGGATALCLSLSPSLSLSLSRARSLSLSCALSLSRALSLPRFVFLSLSPYVHPGTPTIPGIAIL